MFPAKCCRREHVADWTGVSRDWTMFALMFLHCSRRGGGEYKEAAGDAWSQSSCCLHTSDVSTILMAMAIVLTVGTAAADGIVLAPVYWNASNPIFKSSRNSLLIEVNLYDGIDFVCPIYDNATDDTATTLEYYVIYLVTQRAYDACSLQVDSSAVTTILNCSAPYHPRRYTMFFEPFQAIPNAPEFHPGQSYFFISTSTGQKDGLTSTVGGACASLNMKLIIDVCCATSTRIAGSSVLSTSMTEPPHLSHSTRLSTRTSIPSSHPGDSVRSSTSSPLLSTTPISQYSNTMTSMSTAIVPSHSTRTRGHVTHISTTDMRPTVDPIIQHTNVSSLSRTSCLVLVILCLFVAQLTSAR